MSRSLRTLCVFIIVAATPALGQSPAEALRDLEFRPIGPANMGGRVTDVDGIPGDHRTFYVSGADGGVFKTTNGGVTFQEIFNDQPVYSIGALHVAPSDPNVLWVGTGEGDPRNSVSYGNGVYLSRNGGMTWEHVGLEDTERIKRIAVHPDDSDVAYVCALGHEWGPNQERGVFRTTDGGGTWTQVLYIDQDTGCSDLDMDLTNPRILYAGMWTHRRRPWRFDGGGRATAAYRTLDGGDTWEKMNVTDAPMSRIGIQVAPSQPNTVYIVAEIPDLQGSFWRSDDYGDTWRVVNKDPNVNFRPFYYSDIRVDPNNPETVYSLSGGLMKSTDGGRTFDRIAGGVHGDHQSFWIDPVDSDRIISGSDGGFQLSWDGGRTFDIINNVTLSQFYQIFTDDRDPYWVCGGLQDNGHWCGPSNSLESPGILKDHWFTYAGGDGFYAVPVPGQPELLYSASQGGNIQISNVETGTNRRIHPYPKIVGSAGDALVDHRYRFNWDAPIHISPHDPSTVYFGGNVIFKSADFGHSWEAISPDLSNAEAHKLLTSGGEVYQDNTAAEFHATVITIAESPVEPGVIWAGTDDGNIQVTQDGGGTWTNVSGNVPDLPAETWIAKIDASWHDAGTAYVAVDNHRLDDFTPHVYVSRDHGQSWEDLSGGLPRDDYVKVVREDPKNPNLLYLGMDRGMFASWDGGRTWEDVRNNMPPVSVRDIKIQQQYNDLVIGTHGRGAYILDDLSAFQELDRAMAAPTGYLFSVRTATRWQINGRDGSLGQRTYTAPNPPQGAILRYYLPDEPEGRLSLEIRDAIGQPVRSLSLRGAHAGVNATEWNLRYDGPTPVPGQAQGGGGFRFGGGGGPMVIPGTYVAVLQGEDWEFEQTFEVRGDPRVTMSLADYQAQFDALMKLRDMASEMNTTIGRSGSVSDQLAELADVLLANGEQALAQEAEGVKVAVDSVDAEYLRRPPPRMGYRQRPRVSEEIRSLTGRIGSGDVPPTVAQMERLEQLEGELQEAMDAFQLLIDTRLRELNDKLGDYPRVMTGRRVIS
jgi:photosystem II stability/assembly factor-like uncharacterized protein